MIDIYSNNSFSKTFYNILQLKKKKVRMIGQIIKKADRFHFQVTRKRNPYKIDCDNIYKYI